MSAISDSVADTIFLGRGCRLALACCARSRKPAGGGSRHGTSRFFVFIHGKGLGEDGGVEIYKRFDTGVVSESRGQIKRGSPARTQGLTKRCVRWSAMVAAHGSKRGCVIREKHAVPRERERERTQDRPGKGSGGVAPAGPITTTRGALIGTRTRGSGLRGSGRCIPRRSQQEIPPPAPAPLRHAFQPLPHIYARRPFLHLTSGIRSYFPPVSLDPRVNDGMRK